MTRHALLLLALCIVAIAGWAYSVNYKTMTKIDRVSEIRAEIAKERETLQVLRVEWAYLNRPERLHRLVRAHANALGLVPMTPEVLLHAAVVPFPEGGAEEAELDIVAPAVPRPSVRPAALEVR